MTITIDFDLERAACREWLLADLLVKNDLARLLYRRHHLKDGVVVGQRQCGKLLGVSDSTGWSARETLVDLGVVHCEKSRWTWALNAWLNRRSYDIVVLAREKDSIEMTPEERRASMRAV